MVAATAEQAAVVGPAVEEAAGKAEGKVAVATAHRVGFVVVRTSHTA